MRSFQKIIANLVFGLNILVVFLAIFRSQLDLPGLLQVVGRLHPTLLHIPIGIVVAYAALVLFQKFFDRGTLYQIGLFLLYLAALSSAVTALMGLLLSTEGGYEGQLLNSHLITGVFTSLFTWLLLLLQVHFPEKKILFNSTLIVSVILLIVTGHLGGSLTHGENFLTAPLTNFEEKTKIVTDSTSLYEAAIYPVLDQKCVSCHNEQKAKGELIMTSLDKFMAGGEDGTPFKAGDPDHSLMMERILLPEDHDDHMPPSGKPQLTNAEVQLLNFWIRSGADTKTAWTKFPATDSARILGELFIRETKQNDPTTRQYQFDFASEATIEKLSSPFLSITPIAQNEPALKADFFLRETFDKKKFEDLSAIKEQLVILNLSRMPITDELCQVLGKFLNLEKLILNNTDITGKGLSELKGLKKLKSLSLSSTQVDFSSLKQLNELIDLKDVYIWNTKVTQTELKELNNEASHVRWETGPVADATEILRLTPPILVNDDVVIKRNEQIRLKQNLPGTSIRYTVDGTIPDRVNGLVYKDPIALNSFVKLKMRSVKEGWYSSGMIEQYLFQEGFKPKHSSLLTHPDRAFRGEGIKSLTDSKKGTADYYRDIAWVGYHDGPCVSQFTFDDSVKVRKVVVSFANNIYAYIMPPASVEIWGGNNANDLKLITKVTPVQPVSPDGTRVEIVNIDLPENQFNTFKIVTKPVEKLPLWHPGKGQKGWVMIDEIFFY